MSETSRVCEELNSRLPRLKNNAVSGLSVRINRIAVYVMVPWHDHYPTPVDLQRFFQRLKQFSSGEFKLVCYTGKRQVTTHDDDVDRPLRVKRPCVADQRLEDRGGIGSAHRHGWP